MIKIKNEDIVNNDKLELKYIDVSGKTIPEKSIEGMD